MDAHDQDSETVVNDHVEAYEQQRALGHEIDLREFLPDASHPMFHAVLCELIRVEIEQGHKRLEDYRQSFPELFTDAAAVAELAFEEFRVRKQAGESPDPLLYQRRYGLAVPQEPPHWHGERGTVETKVLLAALREESDPDAAVVLRALSDLPVAGERFLNFQLILTIGEGSFGRVFLATQGDLADRPVVLKIAVDLHDEAQKLAQLQHTNVVPIYSVHHAGHLRAACMPFFGPTTLADVLTTMRAQPSLPTRGQGIVAMLDERRQHFRDEACRQSPQIRRLLSVDSPVGDAPTGDSPTGEAGGPSRVILDLLAGMSYVDAVLFLAERLAAGLAHAHERGILHRDLKPANVLVTDEGEPMLLDFNLSADLKESPDVAALRMGGTLPYMSPEQLDTMRRPMTAAPTATTLDARSDIFSLGVVLFEMLTGKLPYPVPADITGGAVAQIAAARRQPPPRLRQLNPAVTPALESIIRHCLQPDPARRYASAALLAEDLRRQRHHRPLRTAPEPSLRERFTKWSRRHPSLTAPSTIAAVLASTAALLLLPLAWWIWQESAQSQADAKKRSIALAGLQEFRENALPLRKALVDWNLAPLLPDRELLPSGAVDRAVIKCVAALTPYLATDLEAWLQLPAVADLPEKKEREAARLELAEVYYLLARATLTRNGATPNAAALATAADYHARSVSLFGLFDAPMPNALGMQGERIAAWREGRTVHSPERKVAVTVETDFDGFWSACEQADLGHYKSALAIVVLVTEEHPDDFGAWLLAGICHHQIGDFTSARRCWDICIALRKDFLPTYFQRGLARLSLNQHDRTKEDLELAKKDFDRVLGEKKRFAAAFLQRAKAQQSMEQFKKAIEDLDDAIGLGLDGPEVYFLRFQIKDRMNRRDAEDDRQVVIKSKPETAEGWTCRGLARLPDDAEGALADFDEALKLEPERVPTLFHKVGVLAGRRDGEAEALKTLDRLLDADPKFIEGRIMRAGLLADVPSLMRWIDLVTEARIMRATLHARLGHRAAAKHDAERCFEDDMSDASMCYRIARVYAILASKASAKERDVDCRRALEMLTFALANGHGINSFVEEPDFRVLATEPHFQTLLRMHKANMLGPPPHVRLPPLDQPK